MTKDEVEMILMRIEANWTPFKNQDTAIMLWADRFKSDPYELVLEAVNTLIDADTSGYRPTIGQVKAAMHDIVFGEAISETEAWQLVKGSLHEAQEDPENLTGARSAWKKLPETIQRLVSPKQLLEWNWLENSQLDTVIESNFMRSYRDVVSRKYRKEVISKDTAQKISMMRDALGLYSDPDAKPELPQPKKLAYEKPDWMVLREAPARQMNMDAFLAPMTEKEKKMILDREERKDAARLEWMRL